MLNAVNWLSLRDLNRLKINLCQGRGASSVQQEIGVLLLHRTQAKQNTYLIPSLACTTDSDFVDF